MNMPTRSGIKEKHMYCDIKSYGISTLSLSSIDLPSVNNQNGIAPVFEIVKLKIELVYLKTERRKKIKIRRLTVLKLNKHI